MRGLTKATRHKPALITGGAVAAMAAAVGLAVAGCSTGSEGVRKEGPAQTRSGGSGAKAGKQPPTSAPPTHEKVDAVKLVKSDPRVNDQIKKNLKPCVKDQYPVDVIYGRMTGGSRDDIVVNILTCGDGMGLGSYVYRAKGDGYVNVFTSEQSPVYADIDRRDLQVITQVYGAGDPVADPSGEDVVVYHWTDDQFRETGRTHTDYSKAGNTAKSVLQGSEG